MKVASSHDRLDAAGAAAVFVVHDEPEVVAGTLLADVDSPFPVVVDTARTSYRAWGLHRASFARVWLDPNVWRQYATLLRAGHRLRGTGRDVRQLGGDFVVDRDGRIAYARPQQRDDRPPAGRLVRAVTDL